MSAAKDTRIHLVEELEQLESSPGLAKIIAEAKAGEFHDFKNDKYPLPKNALVTLLKQEAIAHNNGVVAMRLVNIAHRVIMGEFDEVP